MKNLRIPPIAIAGIGSAIILIAVGLIFGLMIKPNQDEIAAQNSRYDQNYPDSTPTAQRAAQSGVVSAQKQVNEIKYTWSIYDQRLMPRYNVGLPRMDSWKQLIAELTYNLGPDIEKWIPRTGVLPLTSVSISAPPASPNGVTNGPLIIPIGTSGGGGGGGGGYPGGGGGGGYPGGGGGGGGGTITVAGDFRRILYHYQKWNDFNRLVLCDGLALHGNSPFMTATYTAEVIIFPQGDDSLPQTLPVAGGGAGASSGRSGGYPGR